ncbi:MAG: NUDIX domain-containing protein, partial [Calditrichota bacterium]
MYENPAPTTAAIVLNHHEELLLVRRAVEPSTGEWCLPGGFMELGETPEQGVVRELKEETNLDGTVQSLIGLSPSLHGYWGDVIVIGFHVRVDGNPPIPGDDALEARFFPFTNIPPLAFRTHQDLLDIFCQAQHLPGSQQN